MQPTTLLAADVGGTHARLALYAGSEPVPRESFAARYEVADLPRFEDAVLAFLDDASSFLGRRPAIDAACLGVAGPVIGARVALTNSSWVVDAPAVSAMLDGRPVRVANDFEVAASGAMVLGAEHLAEVQAGTPAAHGNRLVIGAGTGLGVAFCVRVRDRWQVVPGEGGHTGFAPRTDEQDALLRALRTVLRRVSNEHVVSGPGIERIHAFLSGRSPVAKSDGADDAARPGAARISELADQGDPLSARTVDLFVSCFGAVAGDHALSVLARGGVYLAGGIAPRMLHRLRSAAFLGAFADKGPFAFLAESFPIALVTHPDVGLLGAAVIAQEQYRR